MNIYKLRRKIVVLLCILVITLSVSTSESYYNECISISTNNINPDGLSIENGNIKFDTSFNDAKLIWYSEDGKEKVGQINPKSGEHIIYGPVWINVDSESNLIFKLGVLSEYTLEKDNKVFNGNPLAKVSIIATRCDLNGNELTGDLAYKVEKETTDSYGNIVNISKDAVAKQLIELNFRDDWKYKIEYKITLYNVVEINDNDHFFINFTLNNLKIRATQENNIGWGITGTNDSYIDSVTYIN